MGKKKKQMVLSASAQVGVVVRNLNEAIDYYFRTF